MADPLSLGLIAGAAALRAGGNIYAGTQEFTRDDRERLRQLERQQAMGQLGLSPTEAAQARRQIVQPLQTIEREAASQRAAQLAGQDLGQGAAYRQMLAEEQVRQQGRLAAQQMLQQQQEAAIARDEAEIAALEDARRRRRQIMVRGGAEALATGVELGAQARQAELQAERQQEMQERMLQVAQTQADNMKYLARTDYLYQSPFAEPSTTLDLNF